MAQLRAAMAGGLIAMLAMPAAARAAADEPSCDAPANALPHFRQTGALIDRLAASDGSDQQAILDRLEALSPAAVPAIVAQMDDRRPLARREMRLVNHAPDAFEEWRTYGPELIVDALSAVLNQLTGIPAAAPIHNGGSDRERRAVVDAWRVHVAKMACTQ